MYMSLIEREVRTSNDSLIGFICGVYHRDEFGRWHRLGSCFIQRKNVPAGVCVNYGTRRNIPYELQ